MAAEIHRDSEETRAGNYIALSSYVAELVEREHRIYQRAAALRDSSDMLDLRADIAEETAEHLLASQVANTFPRAYITERIESLAGIRRVLDSLREADDSDDSAHILRGILEVVARMRVRSRGAVRLFMEHDAETRYLVIQAGPGGTEAVMTYHLPPGMKEHLGLK